MAGGGYFGLEWKITWGMGEITFAALKGEVHKGEEICPGR